MADYRTMSFLPTIKCSQCSRDIEISQMGEHICGGPSGQPSPPYGNFDRVAYNPAPTSAVIHNVKPSRAMPPRVDTSAANLPFLQEDKLTPVSLSPSRSISPSTPGDYRSPYGRPNLMRSATSPEVFSSNSEVAYPTFPTSRPMTPVGTKTREGGYGGFALQRADDPTYAPVSPRMVAEGGLLKRMNTIAPGPFDVNNQRRKDHSGASRGHQSQKSVKDITTNTRVANYDEQSRPNTSSGYGQLNVADNSMDYKESHLRVPRKNGYEGFGPPSASDDQRESLRAQDRSQTFPLPTVRSYSSERRPSEPEIRMRRPSNDTSRRQPTPAERGRKPSGPDLSRPLPPRGASLIRPRTGTKQDDAPAMPNLNLAAEFGIGNPYHTPSTSQSSDSSGYSQVSAVSSRSSPPKSVGPRPQRNPSDESVSQLDTLMSEVQASMNELQPRKLLSASPPPMDRQQFARNMVSPNGLDPSLLSPESPMDPAIQGGRLTTFPSKNPARALRPSAPVNPPKPAPVRQPTGRATSKGNCKGCREPIKGKSISSADGRLTGRYHKSCFVCATCHEPFQTSTFYVIDDAPYCERHYHKLNHSCCITCDKGIEGQYLESERKEKYHPACLTCTDCKRTLRNDYFEMNGRVYCERDAFRRAQKGRFLGPNGATNKMERRTTRLMMM